MTAPAVTHSIPSAPSLPWLAPRPARRLDVRCIALAVAIVGWLIVCDLLHRIEFARGDSASQDRLAVRWARGVATLLSVFLGIRFEVAPDLARRAASLERAIVVANHQSPLDIIAAFLVFPARPLRFIARHGLRAGFPGISAFLRRPGQVLLAKNDREGNARALRALGADVERTLDNVILFPEGAKTQRTYAALRPFKPAGLGAVRAGAPSASIVVVAIRNANAAWSGPRALPGRNTTIRLELAREIGSAQASQLTDGELAAACETAVRRQLNLW